jgi:hypothetical protein
MSYFACEHVLAERSWSRSQESNLEILVGILLALPERSECQCPLQQGPNVPTERRK